MSELNGKKIILGITGSISAYKGAILARELVKLGSEIRVAMTGAASNFITPLTFASLSKHPVALNMFPKAGTEPSSGSWHIDWALWADAMVIAPASAATLAKLAAGLTDNVVTVIATALRGKLFVAPAMDVDMYRYPAVPRNLATLRSFGVEVIPPGDGELASGLHGVGRLAEPDEIVDVLRRWFGRGRTLAGRRVLITAGPTCEPIDAVRFIANRSSGKMGYALAEEAAVRGADVLLISGPVALPSPTGVQLIPVTTADEMAAAVDAYSRESDIVIAAAAVSDFTPTDPAEGKLKRRRMTGDTLTLTLRPTRDILRSVGERKQPGQIVVGFTLETENLMESAREKLVEKGCDLIIANPAAEKDAGFESDTNRITIIDHRQERSLPLMSKRECAVEILNAVEPLLTAGQDTEKVSEQEKG